MRSIFNYTTKENLTSLLNTLKTFNLPFTFIKGVKVSAPLGIVDAKELYPLLGISNQIEQLVLSTTLGGVLAGCSQGFGLNRVYPWYGLVKPVEWDKVLHRFYLTTIVLAYDDCGRLMVKNGVFLSTSVRDILRTVTDFYMELLEMYNPEGVEDFIFTFNEYTTAKKLLKV